MSSTAAPIPFAGSTLGRYPYLCAFFSSPQDEYDATIDGGPPPGAAHGADVDEQGHGTASEQRLYHLIRQPAPIADRQFEIEFLDPGVEVFVFTFG